MIHPNRSSDSIKLAVKKLEKYHEKNIADMINFQKNIVPTENGCCSDKLSHDSLDESFGKRSFENTATEDCGSLIRQGTSINDDTQVKTHCESDSDSDSDSDSETDTDSDSDENKSISSKHSNIEREEQQRKGSPSGLNASKVSYVINTKFKGSIFNNKPQNSLTHDDLFQVDDDSNCKSEKKIENTELASNNTITFNDLKKRGVDHSDGQRPSKKMKKKNKSTKSGIQADEIDDIFGGIF